MNERDLEMQWVVHRAVAAGMAAMRLAGDGRAGWLGVLLGTEATNQPDLEMQWVIHRAVVASSGQSL